MRKNNASEKNKTVCSEETRGHLDANDRDFDCRAAVRLCKATADADAHAYRISDGASNQIGRSVI